MEEKMALTEEKQNESELEDMKAFVRMKKYYGKDHQATKLSLSSLYKNCCKEFKTLFNHKPTPIDKNKKCFCAAANPIWEENPTEDMFHTFECDRTKNPNREFGQPNRSEYSPSKIQNLLDDGRKIFKLSIDTIANNCHLRTSASIPDGGDCGLSAYSVLLRNDSDHLDHVNTLRKTSLL